MHQRSSSFAQVFGEMDLVPVLGSSFFDYFPIILLVLCLLSLLNVGGRILEYFEVRKYAYDEDDESTPDALTDGRSLIERGKFGFLRSNSCGHDQWVIARLERERRRLRQSSLEHDAEYGFPNDEVIFLSITVSYRNLLFTAFLDERQ